MHSSLRYVGPSPWRALYTRVLNLKLIRSGIRSQWSSLFIVAVIVAYFRRPRRDAQQHFESIAVSRGIATEVRWKANCNNLTDWPRKHGAEVEWLLSLMISGLFAIALVERNRFEPVYWCDLSWIARRQRALQDSSQRPMAPLETPDTGKGFGCTRRSFPFEPIDPDEFCFVAVEFESVRGHPLIDTVEAWSGP